MKSLQLVCKTFHCFVLLSTALRSLQKLQEFFPRKMNTAKCEAMSFPQHGNLLSSISGRTPKEYHKDLAVCDFKKKKRKKDGIVKEIGRHHDRHTRYIMLMMMVMIMMTLLR